ncbi:MAG: right-handed parallel beta-helix repeat-containing protein [Prevotella sp.]|nr:right-handed parallel beta-helix repeat-containing protein [Prevotella sp.]
MKKLLFVLVGMMVSLEMMSQSFKTDGDGSTWTLTRLSQTEGSGVSVSDDGLVFTMLGDVTIAAEDVFNLESYKEVRMGDGVRLEILGACSLDAGDFTTSFYPIDDQAQPYGLWVEGVDKVTVHNVSFEGAGLSCHVQGGMDITDCLFMNHNAKSASYALNMAPDKSSYNVENCGFYDCQRSAIGSGANVRVNLTIKNCTFIGNGVSNSNYPQLNLTVGDNVVISNNKIIGERSHTKVGGIVVSNMMGYTGDYNTVISDNVIEDNRFGVAVYTNQTASVLNNVIRNNNTEVNPMNGGSGINVYDPYKQQKTRISGNYIEGNLWGITVVGAAEVNIGKTDDPSATDYNPGQNTFLNNGFDGTIYDLYNNSDNTVYAQGNYWKTAATQDAEGIEAVIFHKVDDGSLGEVIFTPWITEDKTLVESFTNDEFTTPEEIYSLDGTRLNEMRKGINIVHRNGKTVKVIR